MPDTRRTMLQRSAEFQTRETDGELFIEGYFATFNGSYQLGSWGEEVIDPGAFDGQLDKDVRALINHDTTLVLGRTTAGTLTLSTDPNGLFGSIRINREDQDAMNCHARVKRGDVSQCSFGFNILEEKSEKLPDGRTRWTILKVRLFEVSVCTFPAYPDTAVVARQNDLETLHRRELDAWRAQALARLKGD